MTAFANDSQVDSVIDTEDGGFNEEEGLFNAEDAEDIDTESEDAEGADGENAEDAEDAEDKIEKKDFSHRYKAAMKEERARRQELQRKFEETTSKMQRMEQMFSQFQQNLQQQEYQRQLQEQQALIPSRDEDPVGHVLAQQEMLKNHLIQQQQFQQQQFQQQQEAANLQRVVHEYKNQANEFSRKAPDFGEAYEFLVQKKQEEYQAYGYSPEEAHQMLIEDELAVVSNARRMGRNPAEMIYNAAKKVGYQGKPRNSNLDSVERGLKSSKSLSSVSGTNASGQITLEQLASMDPSDPRFDKYWNKLMK